MNVNIERDFQSHGVRIALLLHKEEIMDYDAMAKGWENTLKLLYDHGLFRHTNFQPSLEVLRLFSDLDNFIKKASEEMPDNQEKDYANELIQRMRKAAGLSVRS